MINKVTLYKVLIEENYIIYKDGKLVITDAFYEDFSTPPLLPPGDLPAVVQPTQTDLIPKTENKDALLQFILHAEIPASAKTKGGTYALNKYSEKANKVLLKILKENYNYEILVVSTKLYYKSGVQPKTISNYFTEGIWRSEYIDLATAVESGTAQQYVNTKLKTGEVNSEGSNRFRRR